MIFSYISTSKFAVHLFKASGIQFKYDLEPFPNPSNDNAGREENIIYISDSNDESKLFFLL